MELQNNKVNFTARMDVSNVSNNLKRWRSVANLFETKTARSPEDVFTLLPSREGSLDVAYSLDNVDISFCKLQMPQIKKLLKETDDSIAASFAKLLVIYQAQVKKIGYAKEFLDKMSNSGRNVDADFTAKLWRVVMEKCMKDVNKSLEANTSLNVFRNA